MQHSNFVGYSSIELEFKFIRAYVIEILEDLLDELEANTFFLYKEEHISQRHFVV